MDEQALPPTTRRDLSPESSAAVSEKARTARPNQNVPILPGLRPMEDPGQVNLREFFESIHNHSGCGGHAATQAVINRILQAALDGDKRVMIRKEAPGPELTRDQVAELAKEWFPANEDDPLSQ